MGVVQLVEHQIVILAVAGSSPVVHPNTRAGVSADRASTGLCSSSLLAGASVSRRRQQVLSQAIRPMRNPARSAGIAQTPPGVRRLIRKPAPWGLIAAGPAFCAAHYLVLGIMSRLLKVFRVDRGA